MSFDTGTIVVIVAIAIFYIRLVVMNWRKAKREAAKTNKEIRKAQKEGRTARIPEKPAEKFTIQIRSWWLVGIAFVLVIAGLVANSNWFSLPQQVISLWYVPAALGILVLAVAIK